MELIFDAHAHFDDEAFDSDRDTVIKTLKQSRVGYVVNAGCDIKSSKKSTELAKKYDVIYSAVGVHPENAYEMKDSDFDELKKLCADKKTVAIGEIGLDYHYDYDEKQKEAQKRRFYEQILFANENNLPFVVHERDAFFDCLNTLKNAGKELNGLMHCFSGNKETLKLVLNLGMSVSLGGVVTFKNAKNAVEVAKYVPNDRLLIETDSPYLTPEPYRGKRNSSHYIYHTAKRIADIRECDAEDIIEMTTKNAKRFYGIV